jgi:SAM-dependent methyltransferase
MDAGRARYAEELRRATQRDTEIAEQGVTTAAAVDAKATGAATESVAETVDPSMAISIAPRRSMVHFALSAVYGRLFGVPGQPKANHPLWIDTHLLSQAFLGEAAKGGSILWVSASHPALTRLAERADARLALTDLRRDASISHLLGTRTFDACFFDLAVAECMEFNRVYRKVRRHVRNGGRIYLNVVNLDNPPVHDLLLFCEQVLPDIDVSEATFMGGDRERRIRMAFSRITRKRFAAPFLQWVTIGTALVAFAPIVYATNRRYLRRASYGYTPDWLNFFARFTVVRRENSVLDGGADTLKGSTDFSPADL